MPAVRNGMVLHLIRDIKAFLSLEAGVTRGEIPALEQETIPRQREPLASGQCPKPPVKRSTGEQREVRSGQEWHRRKVGGRWDEMGELQFDFLREKGLQPHHHFLDVGCGSLRGGVRFIPYLEPGHYYGIDRSQELLDAGRREIEAANLQDMKPILMRLEDFGFGRLDQTFDYALAQSVFTHLPLNLIARCLVNVDRVLKPGGVFFATFFENHGGKQNLEPLEQGDGIVSYYDRNPFHYTPDAFAWACGGLTLEAEYIGDWGHPRHQYMMAFRKLGKR